MPSPSSDWMSELQAFNADVDLNDPDAITDAICEMFRDLSASQQAQVLSKMSEIINEGE